MKANNYTKPELNVINLSDDVILTSAGETFDGNQPMQDNVTDNNFWGN